MTRACHTGCCLVDTSPAAEARRRRAHEHRKRDVLDDVKEAARMGFPFTLRDSQRPVIDELISDGLVIETADGIRPHP
ncbi:hypothetical protein [uncultured Methylobacterium sp.]|jgi:hypothetical protein|uniref:hypothetical protein n=1 Tax=uncultured Methylobacterium sp. TaxID=157278 RepID=UPI002627B917|nr:hypothetical protein [uncultured Methylobacterium sp.]